MTRVHGSSNVGTIMADLFTLQNIGLSIGNTQILDDVSMQIPDKGITALVGPSGSGKSSILRLLNRLEIPSSGSILFRGTNVSAVEPTLLRREVGMVFQRPAVFEGTFGDNLRIADSNLNNQGVSEALRTVGLDAELVDRDASNLSGGEAQRLCLARALLVSPKALLLDEPTAALDLESVVFIEQRLLALARQGLPQVWVSHDPRQVDRIADTVIEIGSQSGTDTKALVQE